MLTTNREKSVEIDKIFFQTVKKAGKMSYLTFILTQNNDVCSNHLKLWWFLCYQYTGIIFDSFIYFNNRFYAKIPKYSLRKFCKSYVLVSYVFTFINAYVIKRMLYHSK